MTGQDVPEFDDFESTNENDGDGAIWPGFELPPETVTDSPGQVELVEDGQSDCAGTDENPMDDEGLLNPVEGGVGNTLQPIESAALNGKSSNGRNGFRPPARRPKFQTITVPPASRQAPVSPGNTAAVREPHASSGKLTAEYALMEALADWAAKAKKRSESGQLVAAMVPLAFQVVSRYQRELQPVIPVLIRGAARVAELMHAEGARGLIALMPAILDQTAHRLARLAAQGHVVDLQMATDVLTQFTSAIIEQSYRVDRRK